MGWLNAAAVENYLIEAEKFHYRKVGEGYNSINIDCVQIIYILASWN